MKKISSLFLALCFLLCTYANEKPSLILYYAPYCPYSQQVLVHLQKMRKSISLKNVKTDAKAKEELKKIGGILEVPCLVIDNYALYKSDAIIDWLNEHDNLLYPY
jgi:glutathione S-transferase